MKKTDSAANQDLVPLRAANKAKLDAMGFSWLKARYQPFPSKHPFEMGWSVANSSKRVQIHSNLAVNARGYNLTRASYPAQVGKWYYEVLILDAPELLKRIKTHQESPEDTQKRDIVSKDDEKKSDKHDTKTESTLPTIEGATGISLPNNGFKGGPTTQNDTTSSEGPHGTHGEANNATPATMDVDVAAVDSIPPLSNNNPPETANDSISLHQIPTEAMQQEAHPDSAHTSISGPLSSNSPSETSHVAHDPITSDLNANEHTPSEPKVASPTSAAEKALTGLEPSNIGSDIEEKVDTDQTTSRSPRFPEFDVAEFSSLASSFSDMASLSDSSRRPLPPPCWRLGWATEQADAESPAGTDIFGFSWRADGSLFHNARRIPDLLDLNYQYETRGEASKILTTPDLELLEADDEKEDAMPMNDSYSLGDVLGFGIELPQENMEFIRALHVHQEAELANQNTELKLRRDIAGKQTALNYPGVDKAQLLADIEQLQAELQAVVPVPRFDTPKRQEGNRFTFYKNGVLQRVAILNAPPGSYYPSASMYYQAAVLVNFGPHFAHPMPEGFRAACEMPDAYQIPLPNSEYVMPPPT